MQEPKNACPYLAQGDGAGGQADEPPFAAVGVLGERKLLRQDLDDVLDLRRVVLSHELAHQPGGGREEENKKILILPDVNAFGLSSPWPAQMGMWSCGHSTRGRGSKKGKVWGEHK